MLCIWDAGGTDTLNCSGFSQNQLINLTAGLFSNIGGLTGNVSIALGATIENAVGGSGADTIYGNSANNMLSGDGNTDIFNGWAGLDLLIGGAGGDRFVFDSFAYSDATAATPLRDHVVDYDRGNQRHLNAAEGDPLDLSALLSATYNQGSGQAVGSLVRVEATPDNAFAALQVDLNGTVGGANWVTIALLDNLQLGQFGEGNSRFHLNPPE